MGPANSDSSSTYSFIPRSTLVDPGQNTSKFMCVVLLIGSGSRPVFYQWVHWVNGNCAGNEYLPLHTPL